MFGCHNCKKRPAQGTPYERTACAGCRTVRDPAPLSWNPFKPENLTGLDHSCDDWFRTEDCSPWEGRNELLPALARTVLVLVRMKNRNPGTYRVVEAKIANPYSSYSQLAEILCCRKQNIFYHLHRAVEICPELEAALIVPRRRSRK